MRKSVFSLIKLADLFVRLLRGNHEAISVNRHQETHPKIEAEEVGGNPGRARDGRCPKPSGQDGDTHQAGKMNTPTADCGHFRPSDGPFSRRRSYPLGGGERPRSSRLTLALPKKAHKWPSPPLLFIFSGTVPSLLYCEGKLRRKWEEEGRGSWACSHGR